MNHIGLYIHIPFCDSKCAYCDFKSYAFKEGEKESKVEQYMAALYKEIELYRQELQPYQASSIYFGGGTPSSIEAERIAAIIDHLRSILDFDPMCEITLEVNPGTIDIQKIETYKKAGINRISLGLQSTNDTLLASIGRTHDFHAFKETYKAFMEAGITNISADLMFGLPGQTREHLMDSIGELIKINPKHISVYALKLEEGTPMYQAHERGLIHLPDEESERKMYHMLINRFEQAGYSQYEISNFSKPGYESKHNLIYWENAPYLGLGLSAHSKMNHVRFANTSSLTHYIKSLSENQKAIIDREEIGPDEDLFETIMLGLRLNKGISKAEISSKYRIDFNNKYGPVLDKLVKLNLIENTEDHLRLTLKGIDLSNRVFVEIMDE